MRIALYARISMALKQTPENQLLELKRWATTCNHIVEGVYIDEISSRDTRPQKEMVLKKLRLGEIDGVAFTMLDRWGRNMGELVLEIEEFSKSGKSMFSLKDGIDLSTSAGRFMAHILASMANFERDLIKERTLLGLSRAKNQGKILGRHPQNCGCGKSGHNGLVKPIRNESQQIIAWQYPNGIIKPVNQKRLRKQTPSKNIEVPVVDTPQC